MSIFTTKLLRKVDVGLATVATGQACRSKNKTEKKGQFMFQVNSFLFVLRKEFKVP